MRKGRWARIGLQTAAPLLALMAEVAANQILNAGVWNAWWILAAVAVTVAGAAVKFLSSRTAPQRVHQETSTLGALRGAVDRTEAVAIRLERVADRMTADCGVPPRAGDERPSAIWRHDPPGSARETALLSLLWRVQDLPSRTPAGRESADPPCPPPPLGALVLLGAAGAALTALGAWLWLRWGNAPSPVAFTNQAIGLSFVAGGIAAWRVKPTLTAGAWMGVIGLLVLVSNLSIGLQLAADMPGHAAAVVLGDIAQWAQLAAAGRLLMDLSIPAGSPARFQARLLTHAAWALAVIAALLLPPPEASAVQCRDWCGAGILQLRHDPTLYLSARVIVLLAWTAMALAALRLVVRRQTLATERERGIHRLTLLSCGTVLLLFVLRNIGILAEYAGGPDPFIRHLWSVVALATGPVIVVAAPVAFMIAFFGRQAMFAAVTHLLGHRGPLPLAALQRMLRTAVRDRTLLLLVPTGFGILVDTDGHAFTRPPQHQHLTVLGDPPVAVLLHDTSLCDDPLLLTATARLALFALTTEGT